MTEQEAEVLAARLERIWAPDREAIQRWESAVGEFLRIIEVGGNVQINIAPDGAILCEYDSGRELIGGLAYDTITYKVTQGDFCPDDGRCDLSICKYCRFVVQWRHLFRRNCWLSGIPIEASAHEKAEWIQGFSRDELESWNLKM